MALTINHTFVSSKVDGSDSTLVRPSNWNATHTITGNVDESMFAFTDVVTANVSISAHGLIPKLPNDATKYLNGVGSWVVPADVESIAESMLSFSDVTTANVSTSMHGLMPKLPNVATEFFNGVGSYVVPTIVETQFSFTDVTTANVTTSAHGLAPKLSNVATQFLNGVGSFSVPGVTEATITLSDVTTDNVSTSMHGFAPKSPNNVTKFLDGTGAYSIPTLVYDTINPVTFSTTPVFNLLLGSIQTISLTASVTSSTTTNVVAGQIVVFNIIQNASSAFTFAWPANVLGAGTISATLSTNNVQAFYSDGTNLLAISALQSF